MKPDFVLLGDSHTIALEDGAKALGLTPAVLRFGGAGWHERKFSWGADGFIPRGSAMGTRALARLREEMGVTNIFGTGVPVITTVGFHLGQLVGPMGWSDHHIQRTPDDMPQDGLLMSSAFVEAYVLHYRRPHLRLLRRLAKSTRLVVVPPPTIADYGNIPQVRALLIRLMRNEGLDVFDPVEKLLSLDAPFPEDLSAGDGNHANAAFGSMVIDALRKAGKL